MPFNTTPDIDFSAIGLITDVPPHSLPPGAWSDCLNIRPKDASVQGVLDFQSAGIGLFGTHLSLPSESCYLIADGSFVLGPEDSASCIALGSASTHEWRTNDFVLALEAAQESLTEVSTQISAANEINEADVTSAGDVVDDAKQAIIDKNEELIIKEDELKIDEWSLDTLNTYEYDRLQRSESDLSAATEANALLVSALATYNPLYTAYAALNTDSVYLCTARDATTGVCTGTESGTWYEYKVSNAAYVITLATYHTNWDVRREASESVTLTYDNALIGKENALEAYQNVDVTDQTALDSAQEVLNTAAEEFEVAEVAYIADAAEKILVEAAGDAIDVQELQNRVSRQVWVDSLFIIQQPAGTILEEASSHLQSVRNIYDNLPQATLELSEAESRLQVYVATVKARDDAQEDKQKLFDAIDLAALKRQDYLDLLPTGTTVAIAEALAEADVALGDLDSILDTYSISSSLSESKDESLEILEDATSDLEDLVSSYGSCPLNVFYKDEDACTGGEGVWVIESEADLLIRLEGEVDSAEDINEKAIILFKTNNLTTTDAEQTYLDTSEAYSDILSIDTTGYSATEIIAYENLKDTLYLANVLARNEYNITAEITAAVASEEVSTYTALRDTKQLEYDALDPAYKILITDAVSAIEITQADLDTIQVELDSLIAALQESEDAEAEAALAVLSDELLTSLSEAQAIYDTASDEYQVALESGNYVSTTVNSTIDDGDVVAITQFTESGSDNLVIAYIVRGTDSNGRVIIYDVTSGIWNDVTSAIPDHIFTFDDNHKPQIFVFNGCLIVNPATDCPPLWCDASIESGSLVEIPDWFSDNYAEPGTDEQQLITISGTPIPGFYPEFLSITLDGETKALGLSISEEDNIGNVAVLLANAIGSYAFAESNTIKITIPSYYGDVPMIQADEGGSGILATIVTEVRGVKPSGTPYVTRILRPYNNRLIAMNLKEEKDPDDLGDDEFLPIDFMWSGNIKTQGTLEGLEWSISSVNSAGDSFLTQTPGKIVDGMQLGPYFIAYKEDAVIQVSEAGNALVMNFRSVFEDDGLYSSGCTAPIGNNQHLVIGNYGVYIHDGQTQKQHVAKGIFQDFLFKAVEPAHKDRSFVFQQTRDKEIWFCYSSVGNTSTGCNGAFVYDYEAKKLHRRTLPDVTDLYETELDGELEIYAATNTGIQILDPNAYVSGGWFERKNESLQSNNFKTITGCNIKSEGSVKVYTASNKSINDIEEYTYTVFDPSTDYKVNFRENGRYLSMKVEMASDENPKLTTISFDMKETSRR